MEHKKVAILFFGLTRSLGKTVESLRTNLFTPLTTNKINYDIFIHTYKIFGPYSNSWSNERVTSYNNENIEDLLHPKYVIYDNQETVENSIDFNEYYNKLGDWTGMTKEMTRYLIKNMCLALYSKKRITLLFEEHMHEYDYAIIIRPDMKLNTTFDTMWFSELNDSNIIIPEKDWFSGCNDRMCIGNPNVILYCGKLFDDLKAYSNMKSIISERYLLDKLNERTISVISTCINYDMLRI
jgi:hypothetical protein